MNEYKKNVFIAALVLLAVGTIKATLDHTDPHRGRHPRPLVYLNERQDKDKAI